MDILKRSLLALIIGYAPMVQAADSSMTRIRLTVVEDPVVEYQITTGKKKLKNNKYARKQCTKQLRQNGIDFSVLANTRKSGKQYGAGCSIKTLKGNVVAVMMSAD